MLFFFLAYRRKLLGFKTSLHQNVTGFKNSILGWIQNSTPFLLFSPYKDMAEIVRWVVCHSEFSPSCFSWHLTLLIQLMLSKDGQQFLVPSSTTRCCKWGLHYRGFAVPADNIVIFSEWHQDRKRKKIRRKTPPNNVRCRQSSIATQVATTFPRSVWCGRGGDVSGEVCL